MPECGELPFFCKPPKWLALEDAVISVKVIKNTAIKHKVPGVHPGVEFRFLFKPGHVAVRLQIEDPVPGSGPYRGHGRQASVRFVEFDQFSDVYV